MARSYFMTGCPCDCFWSFQQTWT